MSGFGSLSDQIRSFLRSQYNLNQSILTYDNGFLICPLCNGRFEKNKVQPCLIQECGHQICITCLNISSVQCCACSSKPLINKNKVKKNFYVVLEMIQKEKASKEEMQMELKFVFSHNKSQQDIKNIKYTSKISDLYENNKNLKNFIDLAKNQNQIGFVFINDAPYPYQIHKNQTLQSLIKSHRLILKDPKKFANNVVRFYPVKAGGYTTKVNL